MSLEENVSKLITEVIIRGIKTNEIERQKIQYGLSIMLINMVKAAGIICSSIFVKGLKYTLISYVIFCIIRRYTYGYHCSSSSVCFFMGTILLGFFPKLLYKLNLNISDEIFYILLAFAILITLLKVPAYTANSVKRGGDLNKIKTILIIICLVLFMNNYIDRQCQILVVWGILLPLFLTLPVRKEGRKYE
jgi:accessory gene regulator B